MSNAKDNRSATAAFMDTPANAIGVAKFVLRWPLFQSSNLIFGLEVVLCVPVCYFSFSGFSFLHIFVFRQIEYTFIFPIFLA